MQNTDYVSEVIRLEYLQSLQSNHGKSFENLSREEDIMITFSDLNVWFLNKDSDLCIDEVKDIFDSLEQNKLGKVSLRNFMRAYSEKLMDSVQSILNQQAKSQSLQSVITNAQCIQQLFLQGDCQSNEILSTCSDSTIDTKILKEINYIDNKSIGSTSAKSTRDSRNKIKIQIRLQEIVNIDLKPSFSNPNLEGYQIEIGEDKKALSSSTRSLEGVSINWREELISLTIRPKCQTIFIRLYEVLTSNHNLVAQIIIDPFTLLCPQSFNKNANQFSKNLPSMHGLVHSIPLQSISSANQTYCNLVISASISPARKISSNDDGQADIFFNDSEWIFNILQSRSEYMNDKLNHALSKCQRMIQEIQVFVKPFHSIKLDDNYLKFCQI